MSREQTADSSAPNALAPDHQADASDQAVSACEVADALAKVQEVVVNMKDGELQESLEAAIDAIDSAREAPAVTEGDQLGPVADALEGALDELEKGKIANLLPVIEQAQTIVQSEAGKP